MSTLRAVEAGHGVEDAAGKAPASGDREQTRSTRAAADPGAESERAAAIFAELLGSACQVVPGGQRRVAGSVGISPQLMGRMCDSREPRMFSGAKLVLLALNEPEVLEALLVGLKGVAAARRVGRSVGDVASFLRELGLRLGGATGDCQGDILEATSDGRLDERERRELEQGLRRVISFCQAGLEALANDRAAQVPQSGRTKGLRPRPSPRAGASHGPAGPTKGLAMAKKQQKTVTALLTRQEKLERGELAGALTKQVQELKLERNLLNKQIKKLEKRVTDLNVAVAEGREDQDRLCLVEEDGMIRRFIDPATGVVLAEEPITDPQERFAFSAGGSN